MSNHIVDCRYVRTTTPVGQPDFTLEIEAANESEANCFVAENADAEEDFIIIRTQKTLDLVKLLREQVFALAQFADEMANKGTRSDYEEFQALLKHHNIAYSGDVPGDCEETEDEEDADWDQQTYDQRQREAKLAFEHYDFTAYGGVEELVGWFGVENEERALITLGGYTKPEHVLVIEFEEGAANIVRVGVKVFEDLSMMETHHLDGSIIKHMRKTS